MSRKILLVEAEALVALNTKQILESRGYPVVVVSSGEEAMEVVGLDMDIALVLLDMELGQGIDGIITAKRIQAMRKLPVLFMTNHLLPPKVEQTGDDTSSGLVLNEYGESVLLLSVRAAYAQSESARQFFTDAPIGIFLMSTDGKLLDLNHAMAAILGAPSATEALEEYDLPSRDFYVQIERRTELVRLLSENRIVDDFEIEVNKLDGSRILLNVKARMVEGNGNGGSGIGGSPVIEGYATEITSRKRAEVMLDEERHYLRTVLDTTHDGFWFVDDEARIIDVNDSYCAMTSYTRDELLGTLISDINLDEQPEMSRERFARIVESGFERFDSRHRRKDGSILEVEVTSSAIRTNPPRVVSFFRDITDRKLSERALWQANEELLRQKDELSLALQEKNSLMQELNHRVKNNLQMISSLIRLKESAAHADLSDIRSQIDSIRIVHEMLNKSELAGYIDFREYCEQLLFAIFSTFSVRAVTVENQVAKLRIATKSAIVLGLIVNEIATNAVKYGFDGPQDARFSVSMNRDSESGKCELKLSNNGAPIAPEINLHNPSSLGLQLIAALVQQLRGTIELQRTPSPLYTIRFTLENEELLQRTRRALDP